MAFRTQGADDYDDYCDSRNNDNHSFLISERLQSFWPKNFPESDH